MVSAIYKGFNLIAFTKCVLLQQLMQKHGSISYNAMVWCTNVLIDQHGNDDYGDEIRDHNSTTKEST